MFPKENTVGYIAFGSVLSVVIRLVVMGVDSQEREARFSTGEAVTEDKAKKRRTVREAKDCILMLGLEE